MEELEQILPSLLQALQTLMTTLRLQHLKQLKRGKNPSQRQVAPMLLPPLSALTFRMGSLALRASRRVPKTDLPSEHKTTSSHTK